MKAVKGKVCLAQLKALHNPYPFLPMWPKALCFGDVRPSVRTCVGLHGQWYSPPELPSPALSCREHSQLQWTAHSTRMPTSKISRIRLQFLTDQNADKDFRSEVETLRCWWQLCRAFNCRILYGHYLPTVILIIIGIPSPTHFFIPGLKPFFSANPYHRSLSFSSSGFTTWISQTVYCYFWAYSVFYFLVFLFLNFLVVGSVR